MPKLDLNAFELLGHMIKPPAPPRRPTDVEWKPHATPSQARLYASKSKYILCWSEKGSGKTWGCLDKMVDHCYENENAMGLIVVSVKSMATKGGAWDKLINHILPTWGEKKGLDFSDVKHDEQHNQFVWVANKFGGWGMIVVISCPHKDQLRLRIRGYEPSCVFVDELTSCESVEYFESIAAQLGRRPNVTGVQQYLAACNPEGPTHWVYKKWFTEPFDEETGEWDPDFENIYFPFEDNKANMQEGYLDSLKKIYKHNPLEAARMVRGEWIDRPSGDALFRDLYNPSVHVRPLDDDGMPDTRSCLMPDPNHTIIIGIDPGSVYNSFVFEQWLPVDGKMKWIIFDEIVVTKKRVSYEYLIPLVMARVKWWRDLMDRKMAQVWISDNSAFNQFRAAGGSYDVLEIERIYEANREKFELEPLKVKEAPKFNGSVVSCVRAVQQIIGRDCLIVSSRCVNVNKMFLQLEGKKAKKGEALDPDAAYTPARSEVLHVWDALRYPMLAASINPSALVPSHDPEGLMKMVG